MKFKIPWFGRYLSIVIEIWWQPDGIRYFGQNGFPTSGFDTEQILRTVQSVMEEDANS
jgi:hypothetical protein